MTHRLPAASRPQEGISRILQLTDFHLREQPGATLLGVDTEQSFLDTLGAAQANEPIPDLALLTGDLTQDACPASYQRLRGHLSALPCPVYCLPGNHDNPALMASDLTVSRIHYAPRILLDHWQVICLDSTIPGSPRGSLAPAQLALLDSLLRDPAGRHALIALHHHPVPSGSAWMDTMQLDNAAALFALLRKYPPVRGIVFGHVHQVMDQEYEGIRILGAPSTCFQFQPNQVEFTLDPVPPGYRWLELHADGGIDTRIVRGKTLPTGLNVQSAGY